MERDGEVSASMRARVAPRWLPLKRQAATFLPRSTVRRSALPLPGYRGLHIRRAVIAKRRSNPFFLCAARWIASRSLSSGAHSRDPLARNDEESRYTFTTSRREAPEAFT